MVVVTNPGSRVNAGGMHHHRILFENYHLGYFWASTTSGPWSSTICHISLQSSQLSLPRTGFFPFKRILQACLQSTAASGDAGVQLPAHQFEIIFVGTGTSEGIPRVSCLTNPSKKCPVCTKSAEPINRNKRLNTSMLIRYPGPSGRFNILIDAGKQVKRLLL
ncbi:hypothetical protein LWI28_022088 [Acer negundo]|uniref:Uncharacterized protein n=1 Tax=Acer negundo TaxID=4023 RepID=A0AAD5IGK8_ACENE|nr:hypothetical protein LWI28_022088 [Acer negundo]